MKDGQSMPKFVFWVKIETLQHKSLSDSDAFNHPTLHRPGQARYYNKEWGKNEIWRDNILRHSKKGP